MVTLVPPSHAAYPTDAEWLRLPSVTQSTGIFTSPLSHRAPPTFRNEFVCLRFCAKDLPKRFFGQSEIFASPFGRFCRYPALFALLFSLSSARHTIIISSFFRENRLWLRTISWYMVCYIV